jgi:hypothetical protein
MEATTVLAITGALSAYSSYQQGVAQREMYKIQSIQAQAEGERKALEYELRANDTLRELKRTIAANVAANFAGGVDGLDGSAALVNTVSSKEAGRDLQFDYINARNAILTGDTNSSIADASGQIAYRSGILNAATKLGETYYKYDQVGEVDNG